MIFVLTSGFCSDLASEHLSAGIVGVALKREAHLCSSLTSIYSCLGYYDCHEAHPVSLARSWASLALANSCKEGTGQYIINSVVLVRYYTCAIWNTRQDRPCASLPNWLLMHSMFFFYTSAVLCARCPSRNCPGLEQPAGWNFFYKPIDKMY